MNAGYVRLSRDDDKRNYSSIENQKLIIRQYATTQGLSIDRWYEDDGVSGYTFDRPGFSRLMEDLDKDINTVFVKDFSRLGRHNAKILLLLDEFQERDKHLIVVDDHYDSRISEDDMIGITTWFNERYVKDTSRKIRRALGACQKEGTLKTKPPFGYRRSEENGELLEIVPREARCIRLIYDLYIQDYGYRKIAAYLSMQGTPTPSMVHSQSSLKEGGSAAITAAPLWSEGMVKSILDNDFYIGTLRLRKRARSTIHGKDKRIPKDEQYIFENHHPPIIDKGTYELVQELKKKRTRSHFQKSHQSPRPFGGCLYCKDCGGRLTPITRKTSVGIRHYYICSTYNAKGPRYCPKSHLVEEQALMEDMICYIRMCRDKLRQSLASCNPKDFLPPQLPAKESAAIQKELEEAKKQLQILLSQKIRDLTCSPGSETLIMEAYDSLQQSLTSRIHALEAECKKPASEGLEGAQIPICGPIYKKSECENPQTPESEALTTKEASPTALEIMDNIIQRKALNHRDMEILIDRIDVDENGFPEIKLNYHLLGPASYDAAWELNRQENEIILTTMGLIENEDRTFTSAKYLSKKLTEEGYPQSPKSVLSYITLMIEMGILKPCENKLKPYAIIKDKSEIHTLVAGFR